MYDSFGRNIRYLRISVTDRCNLRCRYCMPEEGVPHLSHDRILSFESIADIARAAWTLGFDKFRFTGGEPLVRRDFSSLVGMMRSALPDSTLAMTTNGTLLAPLARQLRSAGLDSVNVSLDTLDPEEYRAITRGGRLGDALDGIEEAIKAGLAVKLNVVVAPETDPASLEAIADYAASRGAAMQRIREYRMDQEKLDDDSFDRPPRCSSCDRIRLSAAGELRPCLHSDAGCQVDFSDLRGSIEDCVMAKPGHGAECSTHGVYSIGG